MIGQINGTQRSHWSLYVTYPGPGPGDVTGVAVILAPSVHQHQLPGPHGGRGGDVVDNLQLTAFSDEEHLSEVRGH